MSFRGRQKKRERGRPLSLESVLLREPRAAPSWDDPLSIVPYSAALACRHVYIDEFAAKLAVAERDAAGGKREQGMVLADADVRARIIFGAALAHDDVAADDALAAELLHAEARPALSRPLREDPPAFLCAMFFSSS